MTAMNASAANPLGQGMSFPPRVAADGRLAWSAGEDNVRESMRLILMTERSERVMREEFGCGLRQYLFEPNTVTTRERIHDTIIESIGRWEPRVAIDEVSVVPSADDQRRVDITILFRLVATQAGGRMSFTLQLQG
jgi:phage baseplate assembly protein W